MFSIRRYLLVSISLIILAAGTLTAVATYRFAWHEVEELFDAQLVQHGRLLAGWLEQTHSSETFSYQAIQSKGHHYERYVAIQHVSADGALLFSSPVSLDQVLAPLQSGVSVQTASDRSWHVFVQPLGDGSWLMVAEEEHVRDDLSSDATLAIIVPFLLMWPLLMLAVMSALRRGLMPLVSLENALRERHEGHLAALEYGGDIAELSLMVTELNRLFARIDEVLERERRFTDDAAHELRTLLSVLKLHAGNALESVADAERSHALAQLLAGIGRAERTVTQLLALARLEASVAHRAESAALMPALRQVLADLTPVAEAAGQTLQIEAAESIRPRVALGAELLDMLFRNLIDNACRYSPPDSHISVLVRPVGGSVEVRIEDGSEGLPERLRERVGERFLRGDSSIPGTGLGLSIVRRILALCDGCIEFIPRNSPQAAAVVIRLPVVSQSSAIV
ncbi:MAG: hypothetical protein KAG82_01310 [Alcanivoracaceae bacterium]|nr:hypothetical protein [Alcanivoracaceae bacterium]